MINIVKKYLKQPSTWKGLVTLASVAGIVISPEQAQAISLAVLSLIGLWETFRPEDTKPQF